jgi:predicted component of type VI protein secretion system
MAEQVLPFAPLEEVNTDVIYKDDLQNSLESAPAAQGHSGENASTPTAGATNPQTTDRERKMKQAMLKATHQNAHLSNASSVPHQSSVWNIGNTTNALGSSRPEYVAPNDRLANFYKQYNKILLDNIAIAKEKERLALENTQLQDLIQQYLNGTQLAGDTLREDNPLFVVNGRANLNHDPPVRKAKPIVQNAVEIQAATVKQRIA